jgi:hypothetical protein
MADELAIQSPVDEADTSGPRVNGEESSTWPLTSTNGNATG